MATYYKTIKGVRYDKEMIEAADESVSGKRDGRISISDAKKIIKKALDGAGITEVESRTLQYIYDNYNFTPSAKEHFYTYLGSDTEKESVKASVKDVKPSPEPEEVVKAVKVDKKNEAVKKEKGFFAKYFIWIIFIALILFLLYLYCDRLTGCINNDGKSNNAVEVENVETKVNDAAVKIPEPVISPEPKEVITPKPEEVVAGENEYIVKEKDTLADISSRIYGDPAKWKELYEKNKDSIADPAMIYPGQKIKTDIK